MLDRGASGREIALQAGDYEARIVTVGAGLAGLRYRGHELVVPHGVGECPPGYLGKVLMPWPNRVAGGSYSWEGTSYDLPVDEPAFGTALHGFVTFQEWDIVEAGSSSVLLRTLIAARYSYPWTLLASARYSLDAEAGLSIELSATNIGEGPAPYGVGFHPYLAVDGLPADELELENPAAIIYEADASMIPVASHDVASFGLDFRSPALIGESQLDHAFAGLPEGTWAVTLRDPDSGVGVSLSSDARWLQVYSADYIGRVGVAVEPMSCPPNAFNTGTDVVALGTGQTHTLSARIAATGPIADKRVVQ